VWQVAGLDRHEVRTTKVLAWALDRNGSHGLGSAVLRELLRTLAARDGRIAFERLDLHAHYTVQTEHIAFSDMSDRLDIAVT
uniref:PD-(D/E)XK nuclease family protein n=1 Tax=Escherichia coli TaxID=562 RepID=UPI0013CF45BF